MSINPIQQDPTDIIPPSSEQTAPSQLLENFETIISKNVFHTTRPYDDSPALRLDVKILQDNAAHIAQLKTHSSNACSLWGKISQCLNQHPIPFIVLTCLGFVTSAALLAASTALAIAVSGIAFPILLGVVGIGILALAATGFAIQLAAHIKNIKLQHSLLNILRDLKFSEAITPHQHADLVNSIKNQDHFRKKTEALLADFQHTGRFDRDTLETLSYWTTHGRLLNVYQFLEMSTYSEDTTQLPPLTNLDNSEWNSFYEAFNKEKAQLTLTSWFTLIQELVSEGDLFLEDDDLLTAVDGAISDNNEQLLPSLTALFSALIDSNPSRAIYFQPILERLQKNQSHAVEHIASCLRQDMFYEKLDSYLEKICQNLHELADAPLDSLDDKQSRAHRMEEQLSSLYDLFGQTLKEDLIQDFSTKQERIQIVHHFQKHFKTINDLYEQVGEKLGEKGPCHLTCGCHMAPDRKHFPMMTNHVIDGVKRYAIGAPLAVHASNEINNSLEKNTSEKKTILIFTSKAGAGNVTATEGIASTLQDRYHIVIAPTHTEFEEKVYNWFLRGHRWKLMKFMMCLFRETPSSIVKKFKNQVHEQMELHKPAFVITASPHITRACQLECEQRDIPLFAVATDFDGEDFIHHLPQNPAKPHLFKMGIPYNSQGVKDTLKGKVPDENIITMGYPVPDAFKHAYTPEEIAKTRQNVTGALGISPDDCGDVILEENAEAVGIMMGSQGCGNLLEDYADRLLHLERGPEAPPLHVFLCCGKNRPLFEQLKQKYANQTGSVHIHPLPQMPQTSVAKLYSCIKFLITKPGGASVAQAITMGVPLLLDDTTNATSVLRWEGSNIKFVVEQGLGEAIKDKNRFSAQALDFLEHDKRKDDFEMPEFRSGLNSAIEQLEAIIQSQDET